MTYLSARESPTCEPGRTDTGNVTIEARPEPITIERHRTVALVVDMQNDFGAKGGMFDRAGIDISVIQSVVEPTARALRALRQAEISVVYLKMGYQPDLSDLGAADSPTALSTSPSRWERR